MHIVIAAWLYVIAMIALTAKGAVAGVATFAMVGCAPVALYLALAIRRMRARRVARGESADVSPVASPRQ